MYNRVFNKSSTRTQGQGQSPTCRDVRGAAGIPRCSTGTLAAAGGWGHLLPCMRVSSHYPSSESWSPTERVGVRGGGGGGEGGGPREREGGREGRFTGSTCNLPEL